jgi:hypothetical protein
MYDSTTVTVGLDVHAHSVRLAAVRADELLEERTLPYDEEAVERVLPRLWPAPFPGRAGNRLSDRGTGAGATAAGRSGQDRQPRRMQACSPAACSSRSMSPRASWRPRVIWCARARTRVWIGCATGIDCRSSACATGASCRPAPGRSPGASGSQKQRFEFAAQQQSFDTYLHALDLVDRRIEALEAAIRETAQQGPWRELVASLHCLRGIDTLTALALVAEIGDFHRFGSAEELMALRRPGALRALVRRQGSITKVGNSHMRRLLVESAWHARRRPSVGYELGRRQRGQQALVLERAWRCQQRLYRRWQRMAGRGKPPQKIVVACARPSWRASSGRSRPSNHSAAARPSSSPRAADASDHTENPRSLYAAPTGDPRR